MNTNLTYCAIRRSLEERYWGLVTKHASATAHLLQVTGKGEELFVSAKSECYRLHKILVVSRNDLHEHRTFHSC